MKRLLKALAAAAGTLAVVICCSAATLASRAPAVSVQLDGEPLAFTDAVPQIRNNRTFLPLRAVFEALGAEVSYEGNTVTAVRDGRTVTMTIDSTQAVAVEDGKTETLEMDVAPYVDAAAWRTYVPVRFAAQAFGCAVGYDADARTAVIIDVEGLLDEVMAGRSFTYLQKYMDYSQQFNEGIWDTEMSMDGALTISDAEITPKPIQVPMRVAAEGVTSGETQMSMSMDMTMDMTDLIAAIPQDEAETPAWISAMFKDGIGIQMRGDLAKGKLYMNMSGQSLESAGIPASAWFLMDMDALLEESGMDMSYAELLAASEAAGAADILDTVRASLAAVELDSVDDYRELKDAMEQVFSLCEDDAFVKDGDNYTLTVKSDDGISGEMAAMLAFTLTMKDGKVAGWAMDMTAEADVDDGVPASMTFKFEIDAENQFSGRIEMDASGMMGMDLAISGKYAKGTKAPETEPPAGALIIPLDGPTGIVQ